MPLKPWRLVATPHPDVQAGYKRKDEWMADLAAVLSDEGEEEYRLPLEFMRRTYVTGGMAELLSSVLGRLSGGDGDPVVQLKTAFGGGKTHSMLALYHVVRSAERIARAGLWPRSVRVPPERVPQVRVAVLPCPSLDATRPRPHAELGGRTVRTLWGELAVRLLGADGYALVREADQHSIAPGGETLVELLRAAAPCLVLVDEFVAYVRNLYRAAEAPPGGSFDSNLTFLQSLTEAVKRVRNAALVASLPASKVELGGEGGEAALERVEQVFGRVEAVWRPVSVEESFEVVRLRLFEPVADHAARDATCQAFFQLYRRHRADFPGEASEPRYLERLRGAYPIHPEVFDRLYGDWSTLDGFQRTRGALRLLSAVVHALWADNDAAPLILPGSLPLREEAVRSELTRPLPESENWNTVVDTDVDGPNAAAYRLDTRQVRYGKAMVARRLARAIFLETAPDSAGSGVRGVDEARIRLAAVQPEEQLGLFHDCLEQLQQNDTTYLHRAAEASGQAADRYWFDLRRSLTRLAEERARERMREKTEPDEEILRRLRELVKSGLRRDGALVAAHVLGQANPLRASADVPDEQTARLVIMHPAHGYRDGGGSDAEVAAATILRQRGDDARTAQNMLVFLAALRTEVENLRLQAARYLAWESILKDEKALNLDAYQHDEAEHARDAQNGAVHQALAAAYRGLLVPGQTPEEARQTPPAVHWDASTLPSSDNPVRAALARVAADETVRTALAPEQLVPYLREWFWSKAPHVELAHLWQCCARYLYMPRLREAKVLRECVRAGVEAGIFAFAEGLGDAAGTYRGAVVRALPPLADGAWHGLLVSPEAVQVGGLAPSPADSAATPPLLAANDGDRPASNHAPIQTPSDTEEVHREIVVTGQWVGDEVRRLVKHIAEVHDDVLAELLAALGARATAELRVTVDLPEGIASDNLRAALENAKSRGLQIEVS
jgi:predicted AAA+ superfamily ATPase